MNKIAIITGGSRGIGYGIARKLVEDGYTAAILDINGLAAYQENFDELKAMNPDCIYYQGDITDRKVREDFVALVVKRFGRIDVLVNNAGVAPKVRTDILEMTEESFDYVVGTNLRGTMFMTQLAANQMLCQPWEGAKTGHDHQCRFGVQHRVITQPRRVLYVKSRTFHADYRIC